MKTYSRDDWLKAKSAWNTYPGPLWDAARKACSEWTIWPPSEQGQDWRDAPHPSQRVIVFFALEQRPKQTLDLIRRARSWSGVIDRIFAAEGEIRRDAAWDAEEQELEERYNRRRVHSDLMSLAEIVQRISDSAA